MFSELREDSGNSINYFFNINFMCASACRYACARVRCCGITVPFIFCIFDRVSKGARIQRRLAQDAVETRFRCVFTASRASRCGESRASLERVSGESRACLERGDLPSCRTC